MNIFGKEMLRTYQLLNLYW